MKLLILFVALAATVADRFDEARVAWTKGEWRSAVSTLETLEATPGLSEHDRALVAFATGVVLAEEREDSPASRALPAFERARAHAGPGELRRNATYDLGCVRLDAAELRFAKLTEPAAPPMAPPGVPGQPAAQAEEPEDFETALAATRKAYGLAKERFLERLALDWRDPDTRANLEWIQRRFHELDELEQQQQEQEQQEESDDSESSEDQENQDSESSDEEQESEEGDENQEQEPQDDSSQQENEESQDGEEEQPSEPEPSEEGEEEEEQTPAEGEEPQPEETEGEQPQAPPEPTEEFLTKEEVQRLLDRLQELEAEGERVRAALEQSRRVPVERDW